MKAALVGRAVAATQTLFPQRVRHVALYLGGRLKTARPFIPSRSVLLPIGGRALAEGFNALRLFFPQSRVKPSKHPRHCVSKPFHVSAVLPLRLEHRNRKNRDHGSFTQAYL
jgi:hypothetical protein